MKGTQMITKEALEALGITQDKVLDAVVERIVDQMFDEDRGFDIEEKVKKIIKERVDIGLQKAVSEHVIPNAKDLIANMVIQKTNGYGEAKGPPQTLVEYAVKYCEDYMMTNVNYNGEEKEKPGQYGWSAKATRLAHMIDQHLQFHVETAVKNAMNDVGQTVGKALVETMKLKLSEAAAAMRVAVSLK
jgi:hypothetical protein